MILLLIACLSPVTGVQTDAGKATFDLGDGYKASFELPDIGQSYVVDDAYTGGTNKNELFNAYGFTISSGDVLLASMKMYVYTSPQFQPIPEARTEESILPDTLGPRIIAPRTISGALGYIGYDLQVGAKETDTSNALTGFFKCFPEAKKESDQLKGTFEVSGETGGFPASSESLQVFNSLVNSIEITGPGIK